MILKFLYGNCLICFTNFYISYIYLFITTWYLGIWYHGICLFICLFVHLLFRKVCKCVIADLPEWNQSNQHLPESACDMTKTDMTLLPHSVAISTLVCLCKTSYKSKSLKKKDKYVIIGALFSPLLRAAVPCTVASPHCLIHLPISCYSAAVLSIKALKRTCAWPDMRLTRHTQVFIEIGLEEIKREDK